MVTPYPLIPTVSGGRLRNRHLVQQLLDRGHRVENWIVGPTTGPARPWPTADPALTTRIVPGRERTGLVGKLAALASRYPEPVWACPPPRSELGDLGRIDVAVLCQAHTGRLLAPFRRLGIPVVLNEQNVESDLARQLASISPTRLSRARLRVDGRRFDRFESRLLADASLVTAVSDVDAAKLRAMAPQARIEILPSGADVAGISWLDHGPSRSDRLVLLGTLGYLPNLDGARWLVGSILPAVRLSRPNAHVALVGSSPPADLASLAGPDIDLVGPVDEVDDELAAGDVFVAPLRAGSGVRLKLLEAFAHGIPVVATSRAAEGLAVRDGIHLLIADDTATFARAVVRLLEDADLRHRLSRAARDLVEDRYDWRTIGGRFEGLLESVALTARR